MRPGTRDAGSKAQMFFCILHLCIWMLCGKVYVGATKNFFALLTFTEIFAPLSNAEKWRNTTEASLFRKRTTFFEAEWITCGCICTVRKEEWKDYRDIVDLGTKNLFLTAYSAGFTIVANVAIATGPAFLGAPRSSATNLIYYIIYKIVFNLRNQHFAKFAVSSK